MKPFEEREKMYQITAKEILNPTVVKMEILAPAVAKKALPGQLDVYKRQAAAAGSDPSFHFSAAGCVFGAAL